jgi:hypothetical protein
MMFARSSMMAAALLAVALLCVAPANAAIRCDGRYQVNPGGTTIATPYCEDRYLSEVARGSYGISTSFDKIRNSIFEKQRICRMIGHDYRINDICLEFLPGHDSYWSP